MNVYVNKGNPNEKAKFDSNDEQFETSDASGIKKTWWLEKAYQKFHDDAKHLSNFLCQTENNPQIPALLNKDSDGKVLVPVQGEPAPLVPAPAGVKTDETGIVVSQSGNAEKVDKNAATNIPDAKVGYGENGEPNTPVGKTEVVKTEVKPVTPSK